jgi:quercetin dioxygenase-like cupin family protein
MTKTAFDIKPNPAEETIQCGPLALRFLTTAEHSNGSIAAFEMAVLSAQGVPAPAHTHDRYEETIYGIEGVLLWTVEGKRIDVGPGQALTIPRGAVHRFDNTTDKAAKAICIITPALLGPAYFHQMNAVLKSAQGGPPDRAKIVEIMQRHGLTPAAPPPQTSQAPQ